MFQNAWFNASLHDVWNALAKTLISEGNHEHAYFGIEFLNNRRDVKELAFYIGSHPSHPDKSD